jgi:hypothetical protein
MSAAFPTSGTGQDRQRKGFMERANLKNRFAIFEICSLSLVFGGEAAELEPKFTLKNNFLRQGRFPKF